MASADVPVTKLPLFKIHELCLVLSLFAFSSCSNDTQKLTAKDPRVHSQVVDETPPKWLDLFHKEKVGFAGVYARLRPGISRREAKSINPAFGHGRPWSPPGKPNVRVHPKYQAGSDWIRAIEVSLPIDAMSHLRRIWGPSREGQIDGRKVAFFWFDTDRGIQGIFEARKGKTKLSFWSFSELEHILDHPKAEHGKALSQLIGRSKPHVGGPIKRIMNLKSHSGMVISLDPLKFSARLFTCRVAMLGDRVARLEFKLETLGNPSLPKRVESILTRRWGAPVSSESTVKKWVAHGMSIQMERRMPPPMRPPAPNLYITIEAEQATSKDSSGEAREVRAP